MPIVKGDLARAKADVAARDWTAFGAMTDEDIPRQVADNPDAAPRLDRKDFSTWKHVPAPARIDVGPLRHGLGLTQAEFARTYRFTLPALQAIEQGRRNPTGTTAAFIELTAADPVYARRRLAGTGK